MNSGDDCRGGGLADSSSGRHDVVHQNHRGVDHRPGDFEGTARAGLAVTGTEGLAGPRTASIRQ